MEYITEQQIDQITTDTMKALAKEKKITVTIAPESGEPFWEGGINGHFFRIRTGTPVQVPESLARQIALSHIVTAESEQTTRAFRREGGRGMGRPGADGGFADTKGSAACGGGPNPGLSFERNVT